MDQSGLITIVVAALTLLGTAITAGYANRIKRKDRTELFFERYDHDIAELYAKSKENDEKLEAALDSLQERDDRIHTLELKVSAANLKYANLLRRYSSQKKKLDELIKKQKK